MFAAREKEMAIFRRTERALFGLKLFDRNREELMNMLDI